MNLQKELDVLISKLDHKPKLMLHACCAPCASYVVEYLREYFDIYLFYYNPNISPIEEYELRKIEVQKLAKHFDVKFLEAEWDNDKFENASKGMEEIPEGGSRCDMCFALRLFKTAKMAKEYGCEYFTTTLSISPLKNSAKLFEIGQKIAEQTDISYLPSDFKKKNGYKRSTELSNELNFYRQNYCGCRFSKR